MTELAQLYEWMRRWRMYPGAPTCSACHRQVIVTYALGNGDQRCMGCIRRALAHAVVANRMQSQHRVHLSHGYSVPSCDGCREDMQIPKGEAA